MIADFLFQQTISDLPGKDGGIIFLILTYAIDNLWRGYPGLASTDRFRLDCARLVVAAEDLADTSVGHLQ